MTFDEAVKNLTLKFTSGNNISVSRATITREEFDAIMLKMADHKLLELGKE